MSKEFSYTIEEVSQLLKVSKLTMYDIVKKGEIPVFRVGRQMRIDADDLNAYIKNQKSNQIIPVKITDLESPRNEIKNPHTIVISGQDMVLDILGKYMEKDSTYQALRSYTGSLNSLIAMYNGKNDIVSLHMFDGDTGEYNVPYLQRILVGQPYILLHLLSRRAGLYVKKGNPLNLSTWSDLKDKGVKLVNREKGSGARILLDEQLRIHKISSSDITGYQHEESNHYSVASAVSNGVADTGVGIEKAARMVGIDFVPLITESYDLVMLKTPENELVINKVKNILSSAQFQAEIHSLGDYDISKTGTIIHETF
ncbi:helix-turn-helix transcriptional regulator [Niallia taxi]|uniref:substrate-binding domain-containing protein n=1 Tax=Niallia taxi TaxID=2499688 RepID=UPI003D2B4F71